MSKIPLDYKPPEIDLNKMYYDTIKYFNYKYKTASIEDKEYIRLILQKLMYKQKDSIKILNNNLHNIKPTSDRNVYILMQQHSSYPVYINSMYPFQIYDPKTNTNVPSDKIGTQYIRKLPNNVTMLDLFGAGRSVKCNPEYENYFYRGDYNELLKGNINGFIKDKNKLYKESIKELKKRGLNRPSDKKRLNRFIKYIQKNSKIYYPGDYYINFFNFFETKNYKGVVWEFFVKEPGDSSFKKITNESKNIKLRQFSQFQDKYRQNIVKKRRGQIYYITTETIIDKFREIYPDENIVFVPLSCRLLPQNIIKLKNEPYFDDFLEYLALLSPIINNAHNKFRLNVDKYYSFKTPINYKRMYGELGSPGLLIKQNPNIISSFEVALKNISNLFKSYYTEIFNRKYKSRLLNDPRVKRNEETKELKEYISNLDSLLSPELVKTPTPKTPTPKTPTPKEVTPKEVTPKITESLENLILEELAKIPKPKTITESLENLILEELVKTPTKEKKSSSKTIKKTRNCGNKICVPTKILNPKSCRCVNRTGVIGKRLLAKNINTKMSSSKTIKKTRNCGDKICVPTKILNPKSCRCVNRTGVIGKRLLARERKQKISTHKTIKKTCNCRNKICVPTKILNPKSCRCVNRSGVIGKRLLAIERKQKISTHKTKKHNKTLKNKTIKKCRENQILNPYTNRCIKINGVTAKKILRKGL